LTVAVRFAGAGRVTRSRTLTQPVAATLTLTEIAERLAWAAIEARGPAVEITLLGVSVSHLTPQRAVQLELDLPPQDPWRPGSAPGAARRAVDGSMDRIRTRFGRDAVGYLPALLARGASVPEAFRELAEHDL
jgi:DNA polymerase IV